MVIYLPLPVLFVFIQSSLHPCNGQTKFQRTQIGTLHGEGYTERDIAAKLHRSKRAVHNAIVKFNACGTFHDRKRSGCPRKTTTREVSSNNLDRSDEEKELDFANSHHH